MDRFRYEQIKKGRYIIIDSEDCNIGSSDTYPGVRYSLTEKFGVDDIVKLLNYFNDRVEKLESEEPHELTGEMVFDRENMDYE